MLDLGALAQNGANVLVGAMATEAWGQLRVRLTEIFSRTDRSKGAVAVQRLDEVRDGLRNDASPGSVERHVVEVRNLLERHLRSNQLSVEEFVRLVNETAGRKSVRIQVENVQNHRGIVFFGDSYAPITVTNTTTAVDPDTAAFQESHGSARYMMFGGFTLALIGLLVFASSLALSLLGSSNHSDPLIVGGFITTFVGLIVAKAGQFVHNARRW